MDTVQVGEYEHLDIALAPKYTYRKKSDGFVYRGMSLTDEQKRNIETHGLKSSLLEYCYYRAIQNSKAYTFLPKFPEDQMEETANIYDHRTNLCNRNTLDGHMRTGEANLPHFFISSVDKSQLGIAKDYARKQSQSSQSKKPYILKIRLNTQNVANVAFAFNGSNDESSSESEEEEEEVYVDDESEKDHILRPYIPPKYIVEIQCIEKSSPVQNISPHMNMNNVAEEGEDTADEEGAGRNDLWEAKKKKKWVYYVARDNTHTTKVTVPPFSACKYSRFLFNKQRKTFWCNQIWKNGHIVQFILQWYSRGYSRDESKRKRTFNATSCEINKELSTATFKNDDFFGRSTLKLTDIPPEIFEYINDF